jgi:hypothetical protein
MPRIAEELEFVAMKSVAAVGEQVKDCDSGGDREKKSIVGAL